MSFLVDPPMLFASGEAYARLAPEEAQGGRARLAGAGLLALFWAVGASLYADAPWTRPVRPLLPNRDGRDFMVNFPALRVDTRRRGRGLDVAAGLILGIVYPLALWLGWDHGRRRRPAGGTAYVDTADDA
jgi:hypothetical protein